MDFSSTRKFSDISRKTGRNLEQAQLIVEENFKKL